MAKQTSLSKGISTVGSFTRNNLERVGAMIDTMNAKTSKPRQYKAVDLGDEDYQQDLFREQTLKATQQLLGTRFATYGKYAKKVVPNSFFQSTVDGAFAQVAKLAAHWSQIDLPNQHRFANIANLDDEERYAFATDIANQNRALAAIGGLTGLAGLPGLLADTLWLLLVSLRTVYQLAAVYNKPLTGKQGVKMAYELLANADLSKMQEKQALLAGIGIGKGLLDNAQSSGLHNELKNLGMKNNNVNFYAQQIDSIASQVGIDLDQINLSWIRRFLPATAVVIGVRYNSQLIDEVIGVAQATFAPDAKLANRAITDDSKSEAEVSKFSSKEEKQNTEAKAAESQSVEDNNASDNDNKADEKDAESKDSKKKDESADAADSKKVSKTDKTADKQKK
ncbi:EcsC family protein [Psychrobacter alimentarius]|uniref:EcsC family protein n=1 Tax=Psychrobacter alimentarius TaxID=261164 RepID=UPI003FD52F2D